MIKNGESSGLNRKRRRRSLDGKLLMRHKKSKLRRRKRNAKTEHYINEVINTKNPKKGSFLRFQDNLGRILVAEHKLKSGGQERTGL